jgi:chromate transport protein ChrA
MAKTVNYGQYAFLGGFVIAILVGLVSNMLGTALPLALAVLGLLGIIVGLMNISEKEEMHFLVAAIALLLVTNTINTVVSNLDTVTGTVSSALSISAYVYQFLSALSVFVAPAAFVVALKQIYDLAKPE